MWLPILDLTAELETIDITGELELIALEEGRVDLERELEALETGFWKTAETNHPFLTGELPITRPRPDEIDERDERDETGPPAAVSVAVARPPAAPARPEDVPARPEPERVTGVPAEARSTVTSTPTPPAVHPDTEMLPEAYAAVRPNRPAIVARRRSLRMRRRVAVTALTVLIVAACVAVTGRIVGGTNPRRDVTVSIDGQANTVVTRAGTVGALLAAQGVVLQPGDLVVPAASAQLRQGMPIRIFRAFPITVDIDGVMAARRTTRHDLAGLRKELGIAPGLVRVGPAHAIAPGARIVWRTPHDVTLMVDGTSTAITKSTALTVADLLAAQNITLGPLDQVEPALASHLETGLPIRVSRLHEDEVVAEQPIPFPTQYRDDPTLAAGHLATIQSGKNGIVRVVSKVLQKDGVAVQWTEVRREVLVAAVPQIQRRGTKSSGTQKPVTPPVANGGGRFFQSGTATYYRSHAGPGACAHLTLPFGTIVKIVASNGRVAQCRVGDRGPQAWTGHIIDLNPDVFQALAPLGTGVISVKLYIM